jgi:hypothetical protein
MPVEVSEEPPNMTTRLAETEFAVLRQTIASRGTTRMVLLPVTVLGWAALTVVLLLFAELPVASLLSLAVLVAGFEAIHALHVGVERIGRYLQVCYEAEPDGPRWETTAMAVGPALPGGGIDPLFSVVFIGAAVINLIPPALPRPTLLEATAVVLPHAVFIFRVLRARGAAARQRAVELESFKALLLRQRDHPNP